MTLLPIINILNSCLVLLFGLFLSVHIAGGWDTKQKKHLIYFLCLLLLLVQGILLLIWDENIIERFYPLVAHLPIVLALIFSLKKKPMISIVAVLTAYLCCQLPNWIELFLTDLTGSALFGAVSYTISIASIYLLLRRYFAHNAHAVITYSRQTLLLFVTLPLIYYVFDYATTVYSNVLYVGSYALHEFFPTVLAVFYVLFLTAYHLQTQKRVQAELLSSILNAEIKQSAIEAEALRHAAAQTAVYQHDMRHHLTAIDGFLSANNLQQATEYIRKVQADVESITPKRFCENELLNLLCSAFSSKAQKAGLQLTMDISVPQKLSIVDTELCTLLSNGLENALHAAETLDEPLRWVSLYCETKLNKLLIEIKNPYQGTLSLENGLPASTKEGHGYGCRSIYAIAQRHRGICSFEPSDGLFTLRIILPI